MPIVFVHGVNNRNSAEYRHHVNARNGFLRQIVAPALGLEPEALALLNPYWGDEGARFRWDMAVLPGGSEDAEKFGAAEDQDAFGSLAALAQTTPVPGRIVESARQSFPAAVEAYFGAALAATQDETSARALADSYMKAEAYAAAHPAPQWLDKANEDNFGDLLNYYISEETNESMGAGGVLDKLKEGWSRLKNVLPALANGIAVDLMRQNLNATVTRFAGDAFTYLDRRGTVDVPGPIVNIVLASLRRATAQKTAKDDKLIVIAHSFGGEIVYDILTYFAPDLQVDTLISVGSQVGLFEEMKLYELKNESIPADPNKDRMPRPTNLKRWLNVYDTNDVLSYRVSPVFADAQDFPYSTGFTTLQAHGGYFVRPSFYTRLAKRLKG